MSIMQFGKWYFDINDVLSVYASTINHALDTPPVYWVGLRGGHGGLKLEGEGATKFMEAFKRYALPGEKA